MNKWMKIPAKQCASHASVLYLIFQTFFAVCFQLFLATSFSPLKPNYSPFFCRLWTTYLSNSHKEVKVLQPLVVSYINQRAIAFYYSIIRHFPYRVWLLISDVVTSNEKKVAIIYQRLRHNHNAIIILLINGPYRRLDPIVLQLLQTRMCYVCFLNVSIRQINGHNDKNQSSWT